MTEHPLTGLFRVLNGNVFEGEEHKVCVSQMVRVTGVHNDAYIKKTSDCSTKVHDVTEQVIVTVTVWTSLSEGQLRISDEAVADLVVILYKFRDRNLIS